MISASSKFWENPLFSIESLIDLGKTPAETLKIVYKTLGGMLLLPAGIYVFKVNNRNARTKCKICSKLTIRHQNT